MKKILVPIDFTEISLKGLRVAIQFASRTQAQLTLFNVIAPAKASGFSTMGGGSSVVSMENRYIAELYRINQRHFYDLLDQVDFKGLPFRIAIVVNDFKSAIQDYILKHKIDLVVMGTSGENDYSELIQGNHTEQVIRETDCPVIAVKDCKQDLQFQNLLLLVNGKPSADHHFKYFGALADFLKARVQIIGFGSSLGKEELKSFLQKQAEKNGLKSFSVSLLESGDDPESIIAYAKEQKSDMIAMIDRNKRSWLRPFGHSACENLIRRSNMPILSMSVQ